MQSRFSIFLICGFSITAHAQFSPITVTGFSQDVIAEAGPNPFATTTMELDAIGSNKVMYSQAFASFAGITNGLPNNGLIFSGLDSYQLGPYLSNNALFVKRNESFDLNLLSPASYAKLRVVCFSTEGPSTINLSVSFTDNTTTNYINNYVLADWFFGTTNIITQGFGRVSRNAAGPWPPDGLPSNPRIYYVEITLNCADIAKQVSKITCTNVSTSGNAPFPNAVMLGLSGIGSFQNIAPTIIPSDCSGPNGSISLNVSGSSSPYSFSWNTNPVQTGSTATGLSPGTYTCIITDASGCTTTFTGTVPFNNNGAVNITPNPVNQCLGGSTTLTANVTGGTFTNFTWNPGNLSGQTITVSPTVTTTYALTATNAIGCARTAQVTITVGPLPANFTVNNATICSGSTATLSVQGGTPGLVYNWYDAATAGNLVGTGDPFVTPALTTGTTYYVEAVSAAGCRTNRIPVTVTVNNLPTAPVSANVTVCTGANANLTVTNPLAGETYIWYNVATGGTSLSTGASFTVNNVTVPATNYVSASANGCASSTRTAVTISLYQQLPTPVVAVTTTTVSSLTFSWSAIPGATGYEITTNGGLSYQPPSSGATGTTHTISGLAGNTTVSLQVRALRSQPCETSLLSAVVTGTTLSTKEVFVPNVFTPNNDGKNDRLLVFGNYIETMQFRIFNQWGQLIFYSDNKSNGWDGSFKGQQQPVGVYAYTLKVVLTDGGIINKKGSINLVR